MSSGGETSQVLDVFNSAFQVSFPILPNANSVYNTYTQPGGTSPYPLDYVIDQAGRVAYFNTEYDPEAMIAVINNLIAHPAPVAETPAVAAMQVTASPNPFNPRTEISFTLPRAGRVNLDIHDARGFLVRRLVAAEHFTGGTNRVRWDGLDDSGQTLPTGLYLVRVVSGRLSVTGKITLIR